MPSRRIANCLALAVVLVSCRRERPSDSSSAPTATTDTGLSVATGADTTVARAPASVTPPGLRHHWTGDLDGMIARGRIRVLVTLSRTNFFIDRGTQRGITSDRFAEYEKELNAKLAKQGGKRVGIVFVPVVRDELLPALIEGRGDIAAANLSVTEKRLKDVDFSAPLRAGVSEVLVTGPSAAPVSSLAGMAGREVFIRASSSFVESVHRVNDSLKKAGVKPIIVRKADERLEDEDILEMVNAGLVPATIVDDHVAAFWSGVYDSVVVHPAITFATGGKIAWAIRKQSPELKRSVDAFAEAHAKGTTFGNILDKRYWRDAGYVTNPASKEKLAQFRSMVDLFRKYGDRYGFNALLLAAQGYQESGLDQSRRSHVGAIGVMQVTPRTAADPNVAITGIERLEPTLDPNVWFNNVEVVAARDIGRETVTYVRNIYKYYVAYVLAAEQQAARRGAIQQAGRKPR